jgi:regulator of cell morphogenesis and NO signaling
VGVQDNAALAADTESESAPREAAALIAYILERFHAVHRRQLPNLYRLARKVETVHADHAKCPHRLADFLAEMLGELEHHMAREEQVLFPTLLSGGGGCAPFALRRMRCEHDDHSERLAVLRRRTDGFTPPEGACSTWGQLYAGCRELHDDLLEHIRLENDLLFPAFE